eukprot:scaffold87640_cov35-Tisochrysis_lutea.AAC.1
MPRSSVASAWAYRRAALCIPIIRIHTLPSVGMRLARRSNASRAAWNWRVCWSNLARSKRRAASADEIVGNCSPCCAPVFSQGSNPHAFAGSAPVGCMRLRSAARRSGSTRSRGAGPHSEGARGAREEIEEARYEEGREDEGEDEEGRV